MPIRIVCGFFMEKLRIQKFCVFPYRSSEHESYTSQYHHDQCHSKTYDSELRNAFKENEEGLSMKFKKKPAKPANAFPFTLKK